MPLSYDDWQLEESKRLCWEDRLLHPNSTVRYAANIDLKLLCDSVTDPKDHRMGEFGPLFKETVSESDDDVLDKALDALIAYLKAADADVARRYAEEICDAIVANCLTAPPETLGKAKVVFLLWVELEAVDAVLDAMEKAQTHTSMMPLSYEDWQLEESKRLCWEDRLLHMNSKVRYAGNIDLKLLCDSITDPKDHRMGELGYLFKETVSDSDAAVLDKALDALIAYLKAVDARFARRFAEEICDAIVANCLTGPPETVKKAQIVFMLWVELEAVNAVLDAMEKAIKTQVAKAVLPAVDVMFQAISEFGSKIVPPNRLLKMLLEIYDLQDQNIRASANRLTLELCRWIGREPVKSILFEKMSATMKKELDAELANVTVAAKPIRIIRSEQVKEPEKEVNTEESAAEISLEKDEYELVDPVDILTPLGKSGFWNKVKSKKCNRRIEAVAELTKLASTKRIAPGDYEKLCRTLEKLITDRSIYVRVEVVRAIGNLALGLRIDFSPYSHILLRVLLRKFRDKKPIMTEALTNTLQAIHKAGCVTLASIVTDVKAAVESEDPHVSLQTLNWVKYCIDSSNKAVILKVHKDYVKICFERLIFGTAQVCDAALSVLLAIEKSVGMGLFKMLSSFIMEQGMRHGSIARLSEENARRIGSFFKHHSPSVENARRIESFFQEHSMPQLKNAELLEETKQLQKMSLSDSQVQNKRQKQHYGSEKGFQHYIKSFTPFWRGDDSIGRLFTDEKLAETLKQQQEWVKSHKCTRCGRYYDISCDCQQVRKLYMDGIRPGGMLNYGSERVWETAKSAVSGEGGKDYNPAPWFSPSYTYD